MTGLICFSITLLAYRLCIAAKKHIKYANPQGTRLYFSHPNTTLSSTWLGVVCIKFPHYIWPYEGRVNRNSLCYKHKWRREVHHNSSSLDERWWNIWLVSYVCIALQVMPVPSLLVHLWTGPKIHPETDKGHRCELRSHGEECRWKAWLWSKYNGRCKAQHGYMSLDALWPYFIYIYELYLRNR